MKRIFTLILLSLLCTAAYAQNKDSIPEKERVFIMSYLNKYGSRFIGQPFILYDKPIYYTDALRGGSYMTIEKLLVNDTLPGYRIEKDSFMWMIKQLDDAISGTAENKEPLLIFSPAEKLHIREQVKKMSGKVKIWKEKDFGQNFVLLDLDSLQTLIGPLGLGWPDYHRKYSSGHFTFSKPIFLRNDTICIFYCNYSSCSLCGSGELSVFEKHNGEWKRLSKIAEWIS